ncbi:MAG: glycosyltransferase, partial [Gemmatimonadales bacterium]
MIVTVGLVLLALPLLFLIYAYVGYPALLWLLARRRTYRVVRQDPPHWPEITVTLPVYNEAAAIAATLDHILALDYPPERRHVLVISDASDDGTDDIVQRYHDRGVQLLRLPRRGGKTAAENAAGPHLRGSLVVSLDATIRVQPTAVKALVRAFLDPEVGVASGRDYSVPSNAGETNRAESNYVSYEMWVRSLETSLGTIVGASGCFYAIRRDLFDHLFPEALSRDFASPLIA